MHGVASDIAPRRSPYGGTSTTPTPTRADIFELIQNDDGESLEALTRAQPRLERLEAVVEGGIGLEAVPARSSGLVARATLKLSEAFAKVVWPLEQRCAVVEADVDDRASAAAHAEVLRGQAVGARRHNHRGMRELRAW